eukprot:4213120-Pleurochrysis_carterae.AAC.2
MQRVKSSIVKMRVETVSEMHRDTSKRMRSHRLVRLGARVGAVKLLPRVHKDGVVCPVAHQIRVADVVLHQTASTNQHT